MARHSQLVGHLGKTIDHFYGAFTGYDEKQVIKTPKLDLEEKLLTMVNVLKKQRLFQFKAGRKYKSYPEFSCTYKCKNPSRVHQKLNELTRKLDRLRRIII